MHHRLPRPRRPFPNSGRRLLAGALGFAMLAGLTASYAPALALQDQSTPPAVEALPAPVASASNAKPAPKPAPTRAPQKPAPTPTKIEAARKSAPAPFVTTKPSAAPPLRPAGPFAAPPAAHKASQSRDGWHTLALGAGLAVALAALLAVGFALAARRPKPAPDEEALPTQEPEPAPKPETASARGGGFQPSPMFANIPEEPASPPPPAAPPPPAITLEPQRFITTLAQASLRYSLRIDNPADEPLGPLAITVTLLSPDSAPTQTASDEAEVHRLILLHAGGSAQLSGEARMPLSAITPVMLADMRLFVPLLRVAVKAKRVGDLAALPPSTAQADFLIGAAQGADGLAPFRLDDGPVTANRLIAHRQS